MIEMRVRPAWVRWVIDLKKEYMPPNLPNSPCYPRGALHANAIIRWHPLSHRPAGTGSCLSCLLIAHIARTHGQNRAQRELFLAFGAASRMPPPSLARRVLAACIPRACLASARKRLLLHQAREKGHSRPSPVSDARE